MLRRIMKRARQLHSRRISNWGRRPPQPSRQAARPFVGWHVYLVGLRPSRGHSIGTHPANSDHVDRSAGQCFGFGLKQVNPGNHKRSVRDAMITDISLYTETVLGE